MSAERLFDLDEPADRCRYPNHAPTTGYKMGCRCTRCRTAKTHESHELRTSRCAIPGCVNHRLRGRRQCADHRPPPKTKRRIERVQHAETCELCGQENRWYESTLTANVRPELQDLYRQVCAACRRGYIGRIKGHHLNVDWAKRLISLRECELCHNRFPIDNHGWPKSAIDHDHWHCPGKTSCGLCVRGIVCDRCNQIVGSLEQAQRSIGLDKLVAYIEQYRVGEP